MALINCPECGRTISSMAVCCPGCGYPISQGDNSNGNNVPDRYAGNKNLEKYVNEYEELDQEMRELKQQAEELKTKIYTEMDNSRLAMCISPKLKISVIRGYKFDISRDESKEVYEILESKGFDCKTYSAASRTKVLNKFMADNNALPDWLNGTVKSSENNTVKIVRKKPDDEQ